MQRVVCLVDKLTGEGRPFTTVYTPNQESTAIGLALRLYGDNVSVRVIDGTKSVKHG